jgi:hypothetical protein
LLASLHKLFNQARKLSTLIDQNGFSLD